MAFPSLFSKFQKTFYTLLNENVYLNQKRTVYVSKNTKNSIKTILSGNPDSLPKRCIAKGWICGLRKHKETIFIDISDGSCNGKLQVVLPAAENTKLNFGDAVSVEGQLVRSSHPKQILELISQTLTVNGTCPTEEFPLKIRQNYPLDQLRHQPHLRPKHKLFTSLLRTRSTALQEVHNFLGSRDYFNIHTPVITSNDCEGAGEVFSIQSANKALEETENLNSKLFFDRPVYLSVSSQLHLEAAASALRRVYTIGPSFRAENTRTRNHLSEFFMLEVEEAFISSIEPLLETIESLVKHVGYCVLDKCFQDVEDLHKEAASKGHMEMLRNALDKPFQRLTYSEAIEILQQNENLINPVSWGEDLLAEHEQYLVKHFGDVPTIVTHYPSKIKPFYMKLKEENGKNVAENFDLLVPLGGELCGGSLRVDQYDVLQQRLKENNIEETLQWYLELRKFGSAPHGGFGMGFDRLIQFLLGIKHIRDVVPFPRWTHHCPM